MSGEIDYIEGAKRMVAEGTESASKIMAFIREHQLELRELDPLKRKKRVLEFEPSKLFNQVHPIVFQYLAVEGIFNAHAFRRYVIAVFGKPKSLEDMTKMRKDKRYAYYHKNAQQSLYYKYLLIEQNPSVSKAKIHAMYEEMVETLDQKTNSMLDAYEKARADSEMNEALLTEEKRRDLIELIQKKTLD